MKIYGHPLLAIIRCVFVNAVVIATAIPPGLSHAQGVWTQKASIGGVARGTAVGFSIGTKGYVGTGADQYPATVSYDDFWEWDQSTNIWTQKANFAGGARWGAVGFSIGTKGYIGTGLDGGGNKQDFWEYDPALNSWTTKANFPGTPRWGAFGFSIGARGYIGCGWDFAGCATDFWEYNPTTNAWVARASFPGTGRWKAGSFSIGNVGYVGTGFDCNVSYLNDFWQWTQATNTWTQRANFGGGIRSEATGLSIGGYGYIGTGTNAGGSGASTNFWRYDPVANSWVIMASVGGGVREMAVGFSIGCKGYISTGWGNDNGPKNDLWEFSDGPLVTASQTSVTCNGGNNGNATASATGGIPPYTYLWSNGQTSSVATGLSAGNYSVTVTDGSGCGISQTVTVTQPAALVGTVSITAVSCGVNNAAAGITGGSAPYSFQWSNGQTAQTATGLTAGSYSLTVSDANGCSLITTFSVAPAAIPSVSVSSTPAGCPLSNGTVMAAAGGGTPPYSYSWSTGQTTQNVSGLPSGSYIVTVTDSIGCTVSDTISVGNTPVPAVTYSSTPAGCTVANGSATANPSGGSAPYTYQWSNGQSNQTATGLSIGNHSVTVTDANGCNTTISVIVGSTSGPSVTAAFTPAGCTVANGTASANAAGGNPPYSYLWANGQTTSSASALAQGTYTVLITDSNGCTAAASVSVSVTPTPSVTITSAPAGCTVPNGTASATATGGTAPYVYLWSNGQTFQGISGLGPGTYSVVVSDANGCSQSQTVLVGTAGGPVATLIALSSSITLGGSTQLSAGGGGNYSWSPQTGLSCISCANPVATPAQSTTYCVFVTDTNGCTDSACVVIDVEIPCGAFFVPSAFSPNEDGENDKLCVRGNCLEGIYLAIYNRWGEKVFETTDPGGCWDGIFRGKLLNTAVFVYYLEIEQTGGEKQIIKGNISLIR